MSREMYAIFAIYENFGVHPMTTNNRAQSLKTRKKYWVNISAYLLRTMPADGITLQLHVYMNTFVHASHMIRIMGGIDQ